MKPVFNRAAFLLCLTGVIISSLLWYWHPHPEDIPCGPDGGCGQVAASPYSSFPVGSDIPVAAWGVAGYGLMAILSFLRTMAGPHANRRLLTALFAVACAGCLFALRLTYLEGFVIHAWCKWCVGSQTVILLIVAITAVEKYCPSPGSPSAAGSADG